MTMQMFSWWVQGREVNSNRIHFGKPNYHDWLEVLTNLSPPTVFFHTAGTNTEVPQFAFGNLRTC